MKIIQSNLFDNLIWIRGAGELGSATAITFFKSGFKVLLSERSMPLAIRRTVTLSDAMLDNEAVVENVTAKKNELDNIFKSDFRDVIPIVEDIPKLILKSKPDIIIDARMLKQNQNDIRNWANFIIGLGPGFTTGENCHAVIETKRGHGLGRIIWKGSPAPNTGIPGVIGGESTRRVIRASRAGELEWFVDFGQLVAKDDLIGKINNQIEIKAPLNGIIRGLINPQIEMKSGLKIADIDPRGVDVNYNHISDKARAIGRAALEAVMIGVRNAR